VPKSSGELVFLWDVFVQPVNKPVASGDDKLVTVDQLNRIAKQARGFAFIAPSCGSLSPVVTALTLIV
jgi:hypothetical protein